MESCVCAVSKDEPLNMLGIIQVQRIISLFVFCVKYLKMYIYPHLNIGMLIYIGQSRKTAELLLDMRVNFVLSSPQPNARKTAEAIVEVC